MAYEDAILFAGFTETDIAEAADDEELQHSIAYYTKRLEFQLLGKLNEVVDKQVHMGKETALTWWLEHLNPRYSNKPTGTLPDLHIHLADTDPADLDTVSINNAEPINNADQVSINNTSDYDSGDIENAPAAESETQDIE